MLATGGLFTHSLSVRSLIQTILIKIVDKKNNLMRRKSLGLSLLTSNLQLNTKINIANLNTSISQCMKSGCVAIRQMTIDSV